MQDGGGALLPCPPARGGPDRVRQPRAAPAELAFVGFNLAEWATWVSILAFAYQVGGAPATGLVAVVQLVPAALVAPLAAGGPGVVFAAVAGLLGCSGSGCSTAPSVPVPCSARP